MPPTKQFRNELSQEDKDCRRQLEKEIAYERIFICSFQGKENSRRGAGLFWRQQGRLPLGECKWRESGIMEL